MFTKRELYILCDAVYQKKQQILKKINKDENSDVNVNQLMASSYELDDLIDVAILHLKLKDLISN